MISAVLENLKTARLAPGLQMLGCTGCGCESRLPAPARGPRRWAGPAPQADLELLLARRGLPSCSHAAPLHEALVDRLRAALSDEVCRFEWEAGSPSFHCGACGRPRRARLTLHAYAKSEPACLPAILPPQVHLCTAQNPQRPRPVSVCTRDGRRARGAPADMEAAGAHMVTWANNILVYGGMSRERLEVDALYKWDLSSDTGFQPVAYRSAGSPGRLSVRQVFSLIRI